MMKRDARSEGNQISRWSWPRIGRRRKLGSGGAVAAVAVGPMPAVGARRSTRVFVPRSKRTGGVGPTSPAAGRLLRSGKRLALSAPLKRRERGGAEEDDDTWLGLVGRDGGGGGRGGLRWGSKDVRKNGWHPHLMSPAVLEDRRQQNHNDREESDELPVSIELARSFGIVYSRKKRPRLTAEGDFSTGSSIGESDMKDDVKDDDRRFGIVFSRKQHRKRRKMEHLVVNLATPSVSMDLAAEVGFSQYDVLTTLDAHEMALGMLVEPSGSLCFSRFINSLLRWIRRSPEKKKVQDLTVLLLSGSIANVFSLNGIHFVPLRHRIYNAVQRKSSASCGLCTFYGADRCVPLLFLDLFALPSFFGSLHVVLLLRSLRTPARLRQWLLGIRQSTPLADEVEEDDSDDDLEDVSFLPKSAAVTKNVNSNRNGVSRAIGSYMSLEQAAGVVMRGLRLKRHQKKRSSSRQPRQWHRDPKWSQPETKPSASSLESAAQPVHMKSLKISLDLLENVEDSDMSTPLGSHGKQWSSASKSPVERVVSEKLALAEVRQNIDSVRCKANVLVIQTDRCWREKGAEVMLELAESNEWCLVVKMQGKTRISHKPQEFKTCVVNRFTHAYMWAADEGWKIEFLNRWDWVLFKELHSKCRERNSQGKMIPIPGVVDVADDLEHTGGAPFTRPHEGYIRGLDDEVTRALSMDSIYDMDSEDEEWLSELNPVYSDVNISQVSQEDFEKLITTFEKDAFKNPEETADLDRLIPRCQDLGKVDMISSIYDYWINKRNKKGGPLVTIFQSWTSVSRLQFSQKVSYRKKRSFKRQRGQAGKFKPEAFLQDIAEEEVRRVQEAESAAKQAIETAIQLRTRAQILMANAELATYRSVVALRIAEAASLPNSSPDVAASILDYGG